MAVLSRLLPVIGTAYTLQSLAALIFVPQQQEIFYDFTGALGFLSSTFVSLYYPSLRVIISHVMRNFTSPYFYYVYQRKNCGMVSLEHFLPSLLSPQDS